MPAGIIGIAVQERDAAATVAAIERAESAGIPAAWLTTGGAGPDALTIFAAAAVRTQRILLGTSIVPTFPRHPLVTVQQTLVLASLAPGRFRLGVGPSHGPTMEGMFGLPFEAPLVHLREYLTVLRDLLHTGSVDLDGKRFGAHARIAAPIDVPVLSSALRRHAFELCGELADGAITWLCPGSYLVDVALPALRRGAKRANRPLPALIAHAPICVGSGATDARAAARAQLAGYTHLPFYAEMLAAAGFPDARQGGWSDAMIDAVVLYGSEKTVATRLRNLFAAGATEVIAAPLAAGPDRAASIARSLDLVAGLAQDASRTHQAISS